MRRKRPANNIVRRLESPQRAPRNGRYLQTVAVQAPSHPPSIPGFPSSSPSHTHILIHSLLQNPCPRLTSARPSRRIPGGTWRDSVMQRPHLPASVPRDQRGGRYLSPHVSTEVTFVLASPTPDGPKLPSTSRQHGDKAEHMPVLRICYGSGTQDLYESLHSHTPPACTEYMGCGCAREETPPGMQACIMGARLRTTYGGIWRA